jgi:hypothetical protein
VNGFMGQAAAFLFAYNVVLYVCQAQAARMTGQMPSYYQLLPFTVIFGPSMLFWWSHNFKTGIFEILPQDQMGLRTALPLSWPHSPFPIVKCFSIQTPSTSSTPAL